VQIAAGTSKAAETAEEAAEAAAEAAEAAEAGAAESEAAENFMACGEKTDGLREPELFAAAK